jgi:hypothetical protein
LHGPRRPSIDGGIWAFLASLSAMTMTVGPLLPPSLFVIPNKPLGFAPSTFDPGEVELNTKLP